MNKALKPRIKSRKKAHRQPLAAHISGFSIRTNKEHAAIALRKANKRRRQKNGQYIDARMPPKSI